MWHHADMDSVHVERIASSGDQLLKNVRYEGYPCYEIKHIYVSLDS